VFYIGTKRSEDARCISVLQSKSKLDAEETETHVENLGKAEAGLL
jgi:hypothetical protein